ncbi:chloramphenicol phosphotransferase CPT [Streptomyces sp. NBC_00158]|uniref:chloramphenicol phosphotransferase CPT n=1 Tax=Streptomyces sp. NBC_00158 TaxID=2903627 RepID=UPI00324E7DFC
MIVLNGASSSGKSGIVRCLQAVLPEPWLAYGCDSFIDSLPAKLRDGGGDGDGDGGIVFAEDGGVSVGAEFRALEAAWMAGVAAMARAGARILIDDVFLGGAGSQERWRSALDGLEVLWVAVRCDPEAAAGREIARGDRTPGMAASQAAVVHEGVSYDLELDTTHTESMACARAIAARLRQADTP